MSSMPMWEVRNVLYCHMMDLDAKVHENWDYDIFLVKQALTEVIDAMDRELGYNKNTEE